MDKITDLLHDEKWAFFISLGLLALGWWLVTHIAFFAIIYAILYFLLGVIEAFGIVIFIFGLLSFGGYFFWKKVLKE